MRLGKLLGPFFRASKWLSRKGLGSFLERELASLRAEDRVLSVGAGGEVGRRLLARQRAAGFRLVQLDIDERRGPDVVADICRWRSPGDFDVVVMSEVLEHVRAPAEALENVRATLAAGGRLILTAPFILGIHAAPHDYFRFTRHGLELLLGRFERVRIEERNSWAEAIAVLVARTVKADHRGLKALSPLLVALALLTYPLFWAAGRLFAARFLTTGYTVVARKGAAGGA